MTKTKIAIGIFAVMFVLCVTAAFQTAVSAEPKQTPAISTNEAP